MYLIPGKNHGSIPTKNLILTRSWKPFIVVLPELFNIISRIKAILNPPPSSNTIIIDENGPLFVHGNIVVQDNEGNELLRETRLAFCRCGKSSNKPLCDNSHIKAEFAAGTSYNPERLELEPQENEGGELLIKLIENAPFVVEGNYEVIGENQSTKTCKRMSFCRCGASENKPFCDGTHRQIEFKSDD